VIAFVPSPGSVLVGGGTKNLPMPVQFMPKPNGGGIRRPEAGIIDIGAYEGGAHWLKMKKQ
jgi:hypothetical protein